MDYRSYMKGFADGLLAMAEALYEALDELKAEEYSGCCDRAEDIADSVPTQESLDGVEDDNPDREDEEVKRRREDKGFYA